MMGTGKWAFALSKICRHWHIGHLHWDMGRVFHKCPMACSIFLEFFQAHGQKGICPFCKSLGSGIAGIRFLANGWAKAGTGPSRRINHQFSQKVPPSFLHYIHFLLHYKLKYFAHLNIDSHMTHIRRVIHYIYLKMVVKSRIPQSHLF